MSENARHYTPVGRFAVPQTVQRDEGDAQRVQLTEQRDLARQAGQPHQSGASAAPGSPADAVRHRFSTVFQTVVCQLECQTAVRREAETWNRRVS